MLTTSSHRHFSAGGSIFQSMRPFREAVDQGRRRERHGSSLWAYGAVRLIELISFALEILHDSPGTLGLALSGAVVTVIAGAPGNT